jgi:predicted AAA+ superfamily ATPase
LKIKPVGSSGYRGPSPATQEQKLFLWDWSQLRDQGPRFENFVASHLLKYSHFREDTEGYNMELRFLRGTDKREVDFVVLEEGRPLFAVECKTGEKNVNPALFYFMERTNIPKFYQVHQGKKDFIKGGVRVLPFHALCKELHLP